MWISVTNIYLFIFHKTKGTIIITSSGAFQTKPGPSTEGTAARPRGYDILGNLGGRLTSLGLRLRFCLFFTVFFFYRLPLAIFIISISVGVRRFLSNHGVQRTTTGLIHLSYLSTTGLFVKLGFRGRGLTATLGGLQFYIHLHEYDKLLGLGLGVLRRAGGMVFE